MSAISPADDTPKGDVDLFGAPVSQIRERWGRRAFAKNPENQELVATLVAAGWTQSRIAGYLGCDEKTLRKHFSRELADGCDLIEAMALQVLVKKMRSGHAQSINRLLTMIDEKGRPQPPKPREPEHKPEPLGKKAQANLDAQQPPADSGWASRLN